MLRVYGKLPSRSHRRRIAPRISLKSAVANRLRQRFDVLIIKSLGIVLSYTQVGSWRRELSFNNPRRIVFINHKNLFHIQGPAHRRQDR